MKDNIMHKVDQLTIGEWFALKTAIDDRRAQLVRERDSNMARLSDPTRSRYNEILRDLDSVEKKLITVLDSTKSIKRL